MNIVLLILVVLFTPRVQCVENNTQQAAGSAKEETTGAETEDEEKTGVETKDKETIGDEVELANESFIVPAIKVIDHLVRSVEEKEQTSRSGRRKGGEVLIEFADRFYPTRPVWDTRSLMSQLKSLRRLLENPSGEGRIADLSTATIPESVKKRLQAKDAASGMEQLKHILRQLLDNNELKGRSKRLSADVLYLLETDEEANTELRRVPPLDWDDEQGYRKSPENTSERTSGRGTYRGSEKYPVIRSMTRTIMQLPNAFPLPSLLRNVQRSFIG